MASRVLHFLTNCDFKLAWAIFNVEILRLSLLQNSFNFFNFLKFRPFIELLGESRATQKLKNRYNLRTAHAKVKVLLLKFSETPCSYLTFDGIHRLTATEIEIKQNL